MPVAQGGRSKVPAKQPESGGLEPGLLMTLAGVFLGGMALNLTPCVYPLIPITASYFGGRGQPGSRRGDLVLHGSLYILGLAFMNTGLGVSAAFTGKLMGSVLQDPAVLVFVSSVLLLMALSFFGFWELRLPGPLNAVLSRPHAGFAQSLFMGLTLGIVAAPCIGPFIIGLLTMVAQKGDPVHAFLVFFTLSIGLGLPLFFLSLFAGNLSKLPRSGEWMVWIRSIFGWIMLAMAVYFVQPLFPKHGTGTLLLALVSLAAAVHLGFLNKAGSKSSLFPAIRKSTGVLLAGFSILLASSFLNQEQGIAWQNYSPDALSRAISSGKPVILDFYADWCAPCRKLDAETFHDQMVVRESAKFIMVKVDLTAGSDSHVVKLLEQYGVKGVPTVLFLDAEGRERKDLRTIDSIPGSEFLQKMKLMTPD